MAWFSPSSTFSSKNTSNSNSYSTQTTKNPNWKPWAFHPLYIFLLCALHILYIAMIQVLSNRQKSDALTIFRIQQNETIQNPQTPFVFDEYDMNAYLTWQYLPVALATVLAILWETLDVSVRRMEVFHQLAASSSGPGGGGGDVNNALCLEYTGMFGFTVPFRALKRGHYAVMLSSSIFVLTATIITALCGGIWSIEWGSLSFSSDRVEGPKWAVVSVNSGVAITTQVLHGLVVFMGIVLGWMLFRRENTGVYHDPRGIGGVAALVCESDFMPGSGGVLGLFRQMRSYAHSNVIKSALRGVRFRLRHVDVVRADGSSGTAWQLMTTVDPGYVLPLRAEDYALSNDRWDATGFFLTKRAVFLAECIIWLGQAAITGALYQVARVGGKLLGDENGGSEGTKATIAKVVFTLTLTIGAVMWQSIQREMQIFEPWQQLRKPRSKRTSLYTDLVQSDVSSLGLAGSMALGVVRASLVATWAAFSVFMVYVATVFVPPLLELAYAAGYITTSPYPDKSFGIMSGTPALGLAVAGVVVHLIILCNMFFVMLSGRTKPFLPRRPTTLASQILYLCHSDRLLADLRGVSSMTEPREVKQRLANLDRHCQFGWFYWGRGQAWCVGVEEAVPGDQWFPFSWGAGLSHGTRYA